MPADGGAAGVAARAEPRPGRARGRRARRARRAGAAGAARRGRVGAARRRRRGRRGSSGGSRWRSPCSARSSAAGVAADGRRGGSCSSSARRRRGCARRRRRCAPRLARQGLPASFSSRAVPARAAAGRRRRSAAAAGAARRSSAMATRLGTRGAADRARRAARAALVTRAGHVEARSTGCRGRRLAALPALPPAPSTARARLRRDASRSGRSQPGRQFGFSSPQPSRRRCSRASTREQTVPRRASTRACQPPPARHAAPPAPGRVGAVRGPTFPQPMYEALRDLSPELLLPGVGDDRARHGHAAEQQPALHRGVHGRPQPRARAPSCSGASSRATCARPTSALLGHARRAEPIAAAAGDRRVEPGGRPRRAASRGGEQLVLLIRGELLHRYPDALIYAVKARTPKHARHRGEAAAVPRPDRARHHLPRLRADRDAGARRRRPRLVLRHPGAADARRASASTRRAPSRSTRWNDLALERHADRAGRAPARRARPARSPPPSARRGPVWAAQRRALRRRSCASGRCGVAFHARRAAAAPAADPPPPR